MEERYFIMVNGVWEEAPQTKTVDNVTIYNYNSVSNHDMLIADGYTQERFINQSELHKKEVPEKISNLQLRSQLILQGFDLNLIEQKFNQIADATQRGLIITAWEYATNFYRNNPMIVAMGNLLGLTSTQVDEIFIKASKL